MRFSFIDLKNLFHKYESKLSAAILVCGFIFDFLTLNRADVFWDNFFIVLYLLVVGISIIIINFLEEKRFYGGIIGKVYELLPFTLQFCFGGLFSAFLVFYSKGGSIFTSGIFIAGLLALLIGNEFFKKRYERLVFQVGLYFLSVFSFLIILIPVLTKTMGDDTFMLSGVFSLIFISIFNFLLSLFSPKRYEESKIYLRATIVIFFLTINFFYFTNIIPPVPLSMKIGEAYHHVMKNSDGSYIATKEINEKWYSKFFRTTLHLNSDEQVYVFSSVFAPTDLNVTIIHDWQYYDESKNRWVSVERISFNILGGRGNGYRTYSKKDNVFSGKWRVDVETETGQVVGRIRFDVDTSGFSRSLETVRL